MDPVSGPLESWVDGELVLKSYHEETKWMLKMEVVKGCLPRRWAIVV